MVDWHLVPDEKKIHEVAVSRMLFLSNYALVALFFAAAGGVLFVDYVFPKFYASLFLAACGLVALFVVENKRSTEVMLITNQRVLIRRQQGMVGGPVTLESIPFEKLSNVQVMQSMRQRIYGIGNVVFRLPGEEHIVTDISHPYEIERAIYRILEIEREKGMIKAA